MACGPWQVVDCTARPPPRQRYPPAGAARGLGDQGHGDPGRRVTRKSAADVQLVVFTQPVYISCVNTSLRVRDGSPAKAMSWGAAPPMRPYVYVYTKACHTGCYHTGIYSYIICIAMYCCFAAHRSAIIYLGISHALS